MSNLVLTDDQQVAYKAIIAFLMDPKAVKFVLKGYAGTGKSTLVTKFLADLPTTLKTMSFVAQEKKEWTVHLTATTNKACEALSAIVHYDVVTIQSLLELVVSVDYKTKSSKLVPKTSKFVLENAIILVDEASFIDNELDRFIATRTRNCKIIYIGDPAQLTSFKGNRTQVFDAGYPEAALTEVVRQAKGNPIIELATAFRHTVNTGEFFQFSPDGHHVQHLDRETFNNAIVAEFTQPDWKHNTSKVLAWTNKRVIEFNQAIRNIVQGVPELQVGDYAVCNKYISFSTAKAKCNLKTDQTVHITSLTPATEFGVLGHYVGMDERYTAFMPASLEDKKRCLQRAHADDDYETVHTIEESWIDLRAAYACTVNKSQGSTYDKVFIDLDDIGKCNNGNTIARLLYVAVSRARHHVYLTGDLV
jgi:hypothetical protein